MMCMITLICARISADNVCIVPLLFWEWRSSSLQWQTALPHCSAMCINVHQPCVVGNSSWTVHYLQESTYWSSLYWWVHYWSCGITLCIMSPIVSLGINSKADISWYWSLKSGDMEPVMKLRKTAFLSVKIATVK